MVMQHFSLQTADHVKKQKKCSWIKLWDLDLSQTINVYARLVLH